MGAQWKSNTQHTVWEHSERITQLYGNTVKEQTKIEKNNPVWQHSERVTQTKLCDIVWRQFAPLSHSAMTFYLLLKFLDSWTADGNLPYGLLGPHSIKSNLSYNICNVFWKSTAKTWKMTVMQ